MYDFNKVKENTPELEAAVQLVNLIKGLFPKGDIVIVGGVARDLLLGKTISDVDLATNIPFKDLVNAGFELRNISKDDSQPVYKINFQGFSLDLARFRTDSKGAVGRDQNKPTLTQSFKEDSDRRDFTINSMGLHESGGVIDHQGGLKDLNNRVIRTVGNPDQRFEEDATRILRALRFAATLNFTIDPATWEAVTRNIHRVKDSSLISKESIAKEIYKAAKSGPALCVFITHLKVLGILKFMFPQLDAMNSMWHDTEHHPEMSGNVLGHVLACLMESRSFDPVTNLSILFHDIGKAVTQTNKGLEDQPLASSFKGHEGAGVEEIQKIFNDLKFNELESSAKDCIMFCAENHMLGHTLGELTIKVLNKVVNSIHWESFKEVCYCDEASRGKELFEPLEFFEKFNKAESKVKALGDAEVVRKRVASIIDGRRLLNWFPDLKGAEIGIVLNVLKDRVLECLDENKPITDVGLKAIAKLEIKKL